MLLLRGLFRQLPPGADPGETMMALRRYLTSQYDWTGFARRFYTSERFEIAAIAIVVDPVSAGLDCTRMNDRIRIVTVTLVLCVPVSVIINIRTVIWKYVV